MKWKALLPVEIIGKASQTGISQPQNLQHPEATRPFPRPEPHTSLHFWGTAGAPADLQSTRSLTVDVCARDTRCPRGNVFSRADARGSGEGRPGDDLCVPPPGARQELALRPPHLAASAGSHPPGPPTPSATPGLVYGALTGLQGPGPNLSKPGTDLPDTTTFKLTSCPHPPGFQLPGGGWVIPTPLPTPEEGSSPPIWGANGCYVIPASFQMQNSRA